MQLFYAQTCSTSVFSMAATTAKVLKMICTDTPLKEGRFKNSVMRQQQGPVNKQNLDVMCLFTTGVLYSAQVQKASSKTTPRTMPIHRKCRGAGHFLYQMVPDSLTKWLPSITNKKVGCIRAPPRTFTHSLASRHRSARTAHHFKEKF